MRKQSCCRLDLSSSAAKSVLSSPDASVSHLCIYNSCYRLVGVLQTCTGLIRPMQDKAYKMFNAGAYLHQYQQFGIDKQDFDGCFARVEDICASYQAL